MTKSKATRKKRRKKTPFVLNEKGELLVRTSSVMYPLIPLIDGLSVRFFGKGKESYILVKDAIAWCRKEQKFSLDEDRYTIMIEVMEKAEAQHAGEGLETEEA